MPIFFRLTNRLPASPLRLLLQTPVLIWRQNTCADVAARPAGFLSELISPAVHRWTGNKI